MAENRLRKLERNWHESGSVEDQVSYLRELLRKGKLPSQPLALAAALGHPAARQVNPEFSGEADLSMLEGFRSQILELFHTPEIDFGEIPEGARNFFEDIRTHDFEARATLAHYGLIEEGDREPPQPREALSALAEHLRNHPSHLISIAQMARPVFQLIPVYEPEGAGFQRIVNAIDTHRREGQELTYDEVRNRRRMNSGTPGKITRWQVAVVEGAKLLPEQSNRFLRGDDGHVQRLEDQLNQWQQYCQEQGLQLCNKKAYALLQMQEIRTAPSDAPLEQLGINPGNWTILGDPTRQTGSPVLHGSWALHNVFFNRSSPDADVVFARFRPSVVVKKIL